MKLITTSAIIVALALVVASDLMGSPSGIIPTGTSKLSKAQEEKLRDIYELQYISGCTSGAGKKVSVQKTVKTCVCTWQLIDHKYTTAQLQFIDEVASDDSYELQEFLSFNKQATVGCFQKFE